MLLFSFVLCFSACSEPQNGTEKNESESAEVVARVGEREITAAELDQTLQLELHDLAVTAYELRLNKVAALVRPEDGERAETLEVYLSPPIPPRITLPENRRAPRGNPEAPVTIAVFCSYQSPHCKSIQPALRQLASDYAGWVKQILYDLPMKFHRQGARAALAVRCAEAQDALWRYQDGLYGYSRALGEDIYRQLAEQTGLDISVFSRCMEEGRYRNEVRTDMEFASAIGLRSVPVVFINGLYIKGLQSYDRYAFWVDKELERLGLSREQPHPWAVQQSETDLPITGLPLRLVGISLSDKVENSRALIEVEKHRAVEYAQGEEILPGVQLRKIDRNFVLLDHRGEMERLLLNGVRGESVPITAVRVRDREALRRIEQPLGEGSRKLVEPSAVLPLGQKWLENQLQNRTELEKKFVAAEMEVEGHKLLRLEGISDNEFFTALGFEENDVLLRVNDTWVHSGQNSLWEALTSGEMVDVVFMRNGLPHRLQYVVEERGYFEEDSETERGNNDGDDSEEN